MLQFQNRTPFKGSIFLLQDPDGIDCVLTAVKATFTMGEKVALADEQLPVTVEQQFHGDPEQSSIKTPSDVSLMKPGTDVLLMGQAHAPGGRPTTWMDVGLAVGPVRKMVRVFGDRIWQSNGAIYSISQPAPFETMPLIWERAFGGIDRTRQPAQAEARNMAGTGFRASDVEAPIADVRLPNLEDPAEPIGAWTQKPAPACFAPICAHWEPRRSYAGTYDEAWLERRAPYLPKDFDPRFLQLAPPGLVVPGYLKGGEPAELRGVTRSGLLRFRLPSVKLKVTYHLDGSALERPVNLDTVVIEPEQLRLTLVWRTALQCDKKALRVSEVEAALVSLN
jgi:hypothetical protein